MKKQIIISTIIIFLIVVSFTAGWCLHNQTTPVPSISITSTDEYDKYILSLDKICPFNGTTKTSECLDKEIADQKKVYDSLSNETINIAKKISEKSEQVPIEAKSVLSSLVKYNESREGNIEKICSLRNAMSAGGTAVIEDSRKCAMYYNSMDIKMLEDIVSRLTSMLAAL